VERIKRFIQNGLLLSAVSLLLRSIGVGFQAFITARIGAAGTGLYQLVLSVYSPALTLATAGISLSSSRLVAEELGKASGGIPRRVLIRCLQYAVIVSGAVGLLLFLFAEPISLQWLGDGAAVVLLRTLALGLPFIALSSAMNGYFTAVRRVSRTACVQLIEQGFRIALTVFLLSRSFGKDNLTCLFAVVCASMIADVFSCLITLCLGAIDQKRHILSLSHTTAEPLPRILGITLPVSFSSFLRSGLIALEHLLIPRGLRANGASYEGAMAAYGTLSGMAMPIALFPASLLYSFTGLLIPELAEANEKKQYRFIRRSAERVIGIVILFAIGSAGLLFGFAEELGLAIYQSTEAGRYLRLLAPLIPLMYLDSAVDAMLKGLGEQVFTMKVNVIDASVSVISVWFFVPRFGLMGYLLVIYLSELINFCFSYYRLCAVTGAKGQLLSRGFRPLLAVLGAVTIVRLLPLPTPIVWQTACGMASAAMLYFAFLFLLGVLSRRRVGAFLVALLRHRRQGHKTKPSVI